MASAPAFPQADWLAEFPPPRSLPLDQEAVRIYECAYGIGVKVEEAGTPPISFTTVMAALLSGEDDTSRWFAGLAKEIGPQQSHVFEGKKHITAEIVRDALQERGKPQSVVLSIENHLLTFSSRGVLLNAQEWALLVGGTDIGVRHLVASYVLNPPPQHRSQMQKWGFQERRWRSAFFEWVAERYTWESWSAASQRPAPAPSVPDVERQAVRAEALAFDGDDNASEVLAQAAAFHARRPDKWLRMETLFYALVETARTNPNTRTAVAPVWSAVEAAGPQYTSAFDKFFESSTPARSVSAFNDLDISPRVLNTLETARELAAATLAIEVDDESEEVKVGARHLAGALVSLRVDGENELSGMGLAPRDIRRSLIRHAELNTKSADVWRELLGEEEAYTTGRPVELNSDEPEAVIRLDEKWTGGDPLGIRPDVESFASLVASRNVEPPLSIGLFGPWGSGKTTFLKRLRRAVDDRAAEAKRVPAGAPPSPFVANVVHVEFNAWHFAEGALVSSLVDSILRALSAHIKDEVKIGGAEWRKQKRDMLETTKRKVEAATSVVNAANDAVATAEGKLTTCQKTASEKLTSLRAAADVIWQGVRRQFENDATVKQSGILKAVGDSVTSTDELRGQLQTLRNRPARMLGDLGLARTLIFAGLVLVLPPVVAWGVGQAFGTDVFRQALSTLAAIASTIAVWAGVASRAVRKVDGVIANVASEYEKRLAADPDVKTAQVELATAQAAAVTAAAGLQTAREELARAEAELANAAVPLQVLRLVTRRLDDQSYGKELTTLSLARADLEALSEFLRDQRTESTATTPGVRAVDRVILYIDDLDRCEPKDVVRVLQVVHMLLAFELFVVVVAVDARWVEESLRTKYKWLASNDGTDDVRLAEKDVDDGEAAGIITPQDYLEKIFQVSFWLEPMNSSRAARYIGSLVRAPYRGSGPVVQAGVTLSEGAPPAPGTLDTSTDPVGIAGIELDYMRALAAYVGPSPRRVKRLINAYRLIKARMSSSELETFLTRRGSTDNDLRSGPYQIVIGLLVIGTGTPVSSAMILKELAETDPRDTYADVVARLKDRQLPDWTVAAQVIETVMRTQKAKNCTELRGWARKVGRFLLHSPGIEPRTESATIDSLTTTVTTAGAVQPVRPPLSGASELAPSGMPEAMKSLPTYADS